MERPAKKDRPNFRAKEIPALTPFEADIVRYLHITDCNAIIKVWQPYWEYCPTCHAREDEDGVLLHKERKDIIC